MGELKFTPEFSSGDNPNKAILENFKLEKAGLHKVDIDGLTEQGWKTFATANDHFSGILNTEDWWALPKEQAMAVLSVDDATRLNRMLDALLPLESVLEHAISVPAEDRHEADYELAAALNNQLTAVKSYIQEALAAKNTSHE